MRIRFWGTRGSIPVALTAREVRNKIETALLAAARNKIDTPERIAAFLDRDLGFAARGTFGGHSPCVEIDAGGGQFVLCDLGSGARPCGLALQARCAGRPLEVNVFMSHLHWDHIMGFPFFSPAYVAGTKIRIHGCHRSLEQAFRRQQAPPCFPVEFSSLPAEIEFVTLEPGVAQLVAGFRVTPKIQRHTGDSYGYRFEHGGKSVVYSTDSEHKLEHAAETEGFLSLFRDADLVIFDAMYSLAEAVSVKEDWGHSSNVVGVELAQLAGAKHLCLFHHEPGLDDAHIEAVLQETIRFEKLTRRSRALTVSAAYDGMEIEV